MATQHSRIDPRRIGLAAGTSVLASAAWYTAWSSRLARLDEAYASAGPPPPWIPPVEFIRSATVATTVAALSDAVGVRSRDEAVRLGLGLWAGFPAVLLSGSVVHEKVPWQQAAIHAGDWLVKLLLISLTVGPRR